MWAYVRKRGAIGQFYAQYFADVSTKDEWFTYYGRYWELHHFLCEGEYIGIKIPADAPKHNGLRNSDIWGD